MQQAPFRSAVNNGEVIPNEQQGPIKQRTNARYCFTTT